MPAVNARRMGFPAKAPHPPGSPYWKISTNTGGGIWVVPEDFRGVDDLRGNAQAAAVRAALRRATPVAAPDVAGDPARIVRTIAAVGAGLVQPIRGAIPAPAVRAALDDVGIGIVHAVVVVAPVGREADRAL